MGKREGCGNGIGGASSGLAPPIWFPPPFLRTAGAYKIRQ